MTRKRSAASPLFELEQEKSGPGPVYQGVGKQIRAIESGLEEADKLRIAGLAAAARSIAASIDRVSGHTDPKDQASGMQLAALHTQLREHLLALAPTATVRDGFDEWLDELRTPEVDAPPA